MLIAGLSLGQYAYASDYTCTQGSVTRTISVEHEEGKELPCSVKYSKPDQNVVEHPWRAENTKGYCAEKAEVLAKRLESFGWQCKIVE